MELKERIEKYLTERNPGLTDWKFIDGLVANSD